MNVAETVTGQSTILNLVQDHMCVLHVKEQVKFLYLFDDIPWRCTMSVDAKLCLAGFLVGTLATAAMLGVM